MSDSEGSNAGSDISDMPAITRFFGVTVSQEEAYEFDPPLNFRLTNASLHHEAKGKEKTTVYAQVDGETFPLCRLSPEGTDMYPLNLLFDGEDPLTFVVKGPHKVCLSGYFDYSPEDLEAAFGSDGEDFDEEEEGHVHGENCAHGEEDEEESEEEEIEVKPVAKKRKAEETAPAQQAKASAPSTPAKKKEEVSTPAKKEAQKQPTSVQTLPNGLKIEEIKLGNGAEPKPRKNIGVKYRGTFTNGKQFDASLTKPFRFKFGTGAVIQGWDLGLKGMKVGGKRKLVIPPSLAYGPRGAPPDIPPNSTLIFEVELCEA